ncbi:hypothetical protein ACROYT_G014943 [Oculina patagonica]
MQEAGNVVHICFKKVPAVLFNGSIVGNLPGEAIRLQALFEGDIGMMKWAGEDKLILNEGCKVMLVWNKLDTLKNGSVGIFEGTRGDGMAKEVPGVPQDPVQLCVVYDQLVRYESELAKPPADLFNKAKVHELLTSLKKQDPQNEFAKSKTNWYLIHHRELLQSLRGESLVLAGDGRCDSPGHNAKYGTYIIMHVPTEKILDFALKQVTEVANSNCMEKEGLKRCLQNLERDGQTIKLLATDRHTQVQAMMKDYSHIKHRFDPRHQEISECEFECCCKKALNEEGLRISDGFELLCNDGKGYDSMDVADTMEHLVQSFFERGDSPDEMAVDLQTVHLIMTKEIRSDFHLNPLST